MAMQIRTNHYRQLLTPALHRRFTRAAGIILILSYAGAIVIGDWRSVLWHWFPIGPAGLRTLLLFICCISIFVLRVAQLHVGARNTVSPLETFKIQTLKFSTLQTLSWYFFSAWWFSEVYVWSQSNTSNLYWVTTAKSYGRPRLNERPIYLRSLYFVLAFAQSLLHFYYDYDRIVLPATTPIPDSVTEKNIQLVTPPLVQLKSNALPLTKKILIHSSILVALCPFVYTIFIRRTAWNTAFFFARILWSIPKASELSYIPPFHWTLLFRSLISGTLLVGLWELSNAVFDAYVAQEPLKRGQPLTNDSRDINATLVNGLQSTKESINNFAYWELIYICQRFVIRRQTIFSDIDRLGGSMWSQLLSTCLGRIQGINTRISEFQRPSAANLVPEQQRQQQPKIETLPRLSAPLAKDNIFTKPPPPTNRREKIESKVGAIAKSYGQSPTKLDQKAITSLSPKAKQYINTASQKLLTPGQQERVSPANIRSTINEYLIKFLCLSLGQPFRQTFRRRVCAIILRKPYSDIGPIVNAIDALTKLAVVSITEDRYGKVFKDVPLLIRTFATTATNLETFVQNLPVHWTDVEFDEKEGRRVEEVERILQSLRAGLRALVTAFGEYAEVLKLGSGELRDARRIAGMDE